VAQAGSSTAVAMPLTETRLRDVRASDVPVLVIGRVVAVERREVVRRSDGGRRPILSGLLSDGTATVRFTWWDPPREGIERGTVLRAGPAKVREFRGRSELVFDWRTRAEPASAAELPTVDPEDFPRRTAAELVAGAEGFRFEARVLNVQSKSVTVGTERRELFEGRLADASGIVGFTAWSDFRLQPNEALRITGAYVRAFRNRPQLILDDRSRVERLDSSAVPAVDPAALSRACESIARLEARGGAELAEVEARAVALLPPSGLVTRCPECRRTVVKGVCRQHGRVEGVPDLRARISLDDGTGTLTVHADRAQTERLLGRSLPECLEMVRANPDPARVEEDLFRAVFGRRYRALGRVARDDFGLTMYAEDLEPAEPGPAAGLGELASRVGAGAS
jgi:replication factor A1